MTYNTFGEWEHEPSSRTDEYFARTRYETLEAAMKVATALQAQLGWMPPSRA